MARGRPRKTDPDVVLETAMKVFWEQGYEGTSMNDLSTQTGMAKPGLYANFGDKETLYIKTLEHYFSSLGAPILGGFMKSNNHLSVDLRQYLETIAKATNGTENPCGCFIVKSLVECANQPDTLKNSGQGFDMERRIAFLKRFQRAHDSGELPKNADVKALAEFFAAQSLALAVMNTADTDQATLDSFINVAMTVLPQSDG